jgi:hypothetical protein
MKGVQVIANQAVPCQVPPFAGDPCHESRQPRSLERGRAAPGPLRAAAFGAILLLLAAPVSAQTVSYIQAQARVLPVGPSRDALEAGARALASGRSGAQSALANVQVLPVASELAARGGLFRRRVGSLVRIDFLRN